MTTETKLTQAQSSWGDTAVDGLLAGCGAGVVMALYLGLVGLWLGEGLAAMLGRFDPGLTGSPVMGTLAHLAMASIYGILFALILRLAPRHCLQRVPAWLAGLAYSLILLLAAVTVFLPLSGSPLQEISTLHFAIAHAIYGLAMGYGLGAIRQNQQ